MCVPVAALDLTVDELCHAASHEVRWVVGQPRDQVGPQHLRVARVAEQAGEPLQLVAQRVRRSPVEQRSERREVASQPADGDPHAVHRVGHVCAHERVIPVELQHEAGQSPADHALDVDYSLATTGHALHLPQPDEHQVSGNSHAAPHGRGRNRVRAAVVDP